MNRKIILTTALLLTPEFALAEDFTGLYILMSLPLIAVLLVIAWLVRLAKKNPEKTAVFFRVAAPLLAAGFIALGITLIQKKQEKDREEKARRQVVSGLAFSQLQADIPEQDLRVAKCMEAAAAEARRDLLAAVESRVGQAGTQAMKADAGLLARVKEAVDRAEADEPYVCGLTNSCRATIRLRVEELKAAGLQVPD